MLDMKDMEYVPSLKEISEYIDFCLFDELVAYLLEHYQALYKIEYSKDVWAKGWNVKFRKAGKSLCVLYPKQNYFTLLVVVGPKEKAQVESALPTFSARLQNVYKETKEGMGQRWLMVDVHQKDDFYEDLLTLIEIRRESAKSNKKAK